MNRSRVAVGIEREGSTLYLNFRQTDRTVTLQCAPRAGGALSASLNAATSSDEDFEADFEIVGLLTVKEGSK